MEQNSPYSQSNSAQVIFSLHPGFPFFLLARALRALLGGSREIAREAA